MQTRVLRIFSVAALSAWAPVAGLSAQQDASGPLSAINWLSDSVATPVAAVPSTPLTPPSDISASALPAVVTTLPLDGALPDAIGLFPPGSAGLPSDLWGASPAADIARRVRNEPLEMLPQMQDLLRRVLLARLDPPVDATDDTSLYLARVDRLLQLGLLTEAEALLEAAPKDNPEIFRRAFDVALLTGGETEACRTMKASPEFSPTYPARIFCLARMGDWQAAALTLESANAVGILTADQDHLMARFLDPELFEDQPPPRAPRRPSPLIYRIYEAIGEPEATTALPIAFAHADLRQNSGWKARIEAAERLAETGAIPAQDLFSRYRESRPSASGGVWERAAAIQALDKAIERRDADAVAAAIGPAWDHMQAARLEHPFAELYGPELARLPLTGPARGLAFRIGLLSDDYASIAEEFRPETPDDRFLISLARGIPGYGRAADPLTRAVRDGFLASTVPARYRALLDADKRGEALLFAIRQFSDGAYGDYDQISDALALFRYLGMEDDARQVSLELLIMERRG